MPILENDALSLEYKLMYGRASWDGDINHVGDNSVAVRRLGLGQQVGDLLCGELRPITDHRTYLVLVSGD